MTFTQTKDQTSVFQAYFFCIKGEIPILHIIVAMMIFLGYLWLFFSLINAAPYIPGEPGAPWTEEEVLIVKSKLFSVFNFEGGKWALNQVYSDVFKMCDGEEDIYTRLPNAAKFLRLGFHDCLKYEDGSGGCDGCLNWENVGKIYTEFEQHKYPDLHKSDNNGLECAVYLLEHIYTNASFPAKMAPSLKTSLKDSGKSRADLWAFASIAAVEYGIISNNMMCEGTYNKNPMHQCHVDVGTDDCELKLPRKIDFKTGRRDCTSMGDQPFISTKHESHPDIQGNGDMTIDFFQKDFGMNGKEMIAIMGSHTLGRLHRSTSLFKYVWTTRGEHLFNNHYFK